MQEADREAILAMGGGADQRPARVPGGTEVAMPGASFAQIAAEQEALATILAAEAVRLGQILEEISAWQPAFGGKMSAG